MVTYLFIDLVASTLMLPWLPTIIKELCEKDAGLKAVWEFVHTKILRAKGGVELSAKDATFIGSCAASLMSLTQYICSSTFGAMSDTMGRKSVLLMLCIMHIFSHLLLASSGVSIVFFLLARILLGATRANVGILSAMISDVSDRESRTGAMASLGIAYSLAFTVGPKASSWILNKLFFSKESSGSVLGPHIGLFAAFLVCIDLLMLFTFPETATLKKDTEKKMAPKRSLWQSLKILNPIELFRFHGIEDYQTRAKMQKMAQVLFLHMSLYSGLECSLLFLAQQRFGYTGEKQSHIFLFTGVSMVIVQHGIMKYLKGGREIKTVLTAMLLQVMAYLTLGFSISEWMFYTGLLFYSVTSSLFSPTFNSLASLSIGSQQQGQVMGIFRSINGLARCVGPSLVGTLMWRVGTTTTFTLGAGATILVAVVFKSIPNLEVFPTNAQAKASTVSPEKKSS
ncbi:unnamed protein product [Hymenolepis diminuta]|nr:unnamed protein product [Hymenolepis diminuta]